MSEFSTFDVQDYLTTPEDRAAYLNAALELDNREFFKKALEEVAKAEGMSNVAEHADMSRTSLYKTFDKDCRSSFETVEKVLSALGLRLQVAVK